MISVPDEYVTGGKFEDLGPALSLIFINKQLAFLFMVMILSNGLHAVTGVTIIKEESAMQRQTAMMLVTPSVWIFFLLYSGEGSETFDWKQLVGLLMLVTGTFWYIHADRAFGEQLAR